MLAILPAMAAVACSSQVSAPSLASSTGTHRAAQAVSPHHRVRVVVRPRTVPAGGRVSIHIYGCRRPTPPDRRQPGRFEDSTHTHGPATAFPLAHVGSSLATTFTIPDRASRGRALIGSVCLQPPNAYTYITIT
jgi:hypothetical protein